LDPDVLAPVAYLAVEFPSGRVTGEGFDLIRGLVARGIIDVLDLEFISKSGDGVVGRVSLDDIEHASDVDISQWKGMYSGLLDQDDIDAIASATEPGSLTGIIVYENVWATPLLSAIDENGARLVGAGTVDTDDLIDALRGIGPA
jgi:hypothetical protein